ncbi:zinc metalloproteinase dpy-31-like [Orbicella faveolata]|uniref:zinc metalloproteinase dpy-31-like n=1 Tax=Orbicella faveolata TaxID=48498 RepID=UPI0009E53D27|nr:zinc metalloproteinase dpy-31-like [Orbicella faveolata]
MAYYERVTSSLEKGQTRDVFSSLQEGTTSNKGYFMVETDQAGCSSNVGMICWQGGEHLNLAKGCWDKGVVIHEIAHALGFLHEQDRPDRDQYVRIRKENLQDGWKTVLNKPNDMWNYDTSGTPHDYPSIMHYTKTAFAKTGHDGRLLTTIEVKDTSASSF